MRSNPLAQILSVFMIASACSPQTEPDKNRSLPDEVSRVVVEEALSEASTVPDNNRYGRHYTIVRNLIEAGELIQARTILDDLLYGSQASDPVYYTSAAYGGYLELLVVWMRAAQSQKDLQEIVLNAMQRFESYFVQPCLGREATCELVEQALSQSRDTVWLILQIAEQKDNSLVRLRTLGLAYDLLNRRGSARLESSYLQTALEVLTLVEEGRLQMTVQEARKHLLNVITLSNQRDWTLADTEKIEWFELIRPWEYTRDSNRFLNDLRAELVPFLPIYQNRGSATREGLREVVEARIVEITEGKKNLEQYPAYSDIRLEAITEGELGASYLSLELYFQNLSITNANEYMTNVSNKAAFIDRTYEMLKTLIRWDIAQLGLDTTEKLHARLAEQEAVTNAHFQDVLDWSQTLIPTWTEFHSIRLWSAKAFMESNVRFSTNISEFQAQKFFSSINRNILRTVTYPNMLAFASKMMQTEWAAKIRFLWFEFDLDSTTIMDYMMTGQYHTPWFNFTNLSDGSPRRLEERRSLFRTDMLDAFYYLFATRTHQIYEIDASDFVADLAETLIKRRRTQYEETLERQKELYFVEGTPATQMIRWCGGIRSGDFVEENIPYYSLSLYVTPNVFEMRGDNPTTKLSVYHGDQYGKGLDLRVHETNDRLRLELLPILETVESYLRIVERLGDQYVVLGINDLYEARQEVAKIRHLQRTYLGVQKAITEKVGDCLFVADQEAQRRIRELVSANYEYYKKVVHPLMTQIKEGVITVDQANEVIQEFHGGHEGILDSFTASRGNDPVYVMEKGTHLLRVRQLMINGVDFTSPYTESLQIPPVVGDHLEIAVPPGFLEDGHNNPYINENSAKNTIFAVHYSSDAAEFAETAASRTMDGSRFEIDEARFTDWDQYELEPYAFNFRYVVENHAIFYQIPTHRYYDVEQANCWVTNPNDLGEGCLREEAASIEPLRLTMERILRSYRLTERDQWMFDILSMQGRAGRHSLSTVLELDAAMGGRNYGVNSLPYTRLAGLMDLPYQMLSSDVLGLSFMTPWDHKQMEGQDMSAEVSCSGRRDGCHWQFERQIGKEFFWARGKRPGFIFNYDFQIVAEDYSRIRRQVSSKYQRLIDLQENSSSYVEDMIARDESLASVVVSVYKDPMQPYGLNIRYQHTGREVEKYFEEETEGYFLEEHDWQQELTVQ
jgi:hypothetical protein